VVKNREVVGFIVIALLSAATYYNFFLDDAFISLRYAKNLAEHGSLSYNLGERVEGITNFGHTLLLSFFRTYRHPLFMIKLVSLLGFIASVILFYFITENKGITLLLAIDGFYSAWANDGLETSVFTTLLLLGLLLAEKKHFLSSGLVLGFSSWWRIEGLLLGAILFYKYKDKRQLWFIAPFTLLSAFRLWYFGSLIPHTFPAKLALYNIFLSGWDKLFMVFVKIAAVSVFYPLLIFNYLKNIRDPVAWFPLLLFFGYSMTPIGGLRYIAYGVPFLLLFTKKVPKAYFVYVLLVSLGLHFYLMGQGPSMEAFTSVSKNIASLNDGSPVAVADAGLLGFYQNDTRVIDVLGLNSKEASDYLFRRDFIGLCSYLKSQDIKYAVLSQDKVSLELEKCLNFCNRSFTKSYAPLVYSGATIKVYECG